MLGFVGYQLWGTGLSTAAAQADLKAQFAASLQTTTTEVAVVTTEVAVTSVATTSAPNPDSSTTTSAPKPTGPTTTEVERQVIPEFSSGDVVGQLVIPSIDVDFFVVSGVGVEELRLGPGHFTDTLYLANSGTVQSQGTGQRTANHSTISTNSQQVMTSSLPRPLAPTPTRYETSRWSNQPTTGLSPQQTEHRNADPHHLSPEMVRCTTAYRLS